MRLASPAALGLAAFALGCDPQVDSLYRGDPLATISVRLLERDGRTTQNELEVGLAWVTRGGAELVRLDTIVDEETGTHHARVFDPPAGDALLDCDTDTAGQPANRIGFGWILAARPGALNPRAIALAEVISMRNAGDVAGWSQDHLIAYVEGEVRDGGHASRLLGAPLDRGMHAMEGAERLRAISSREEVLIRVDGEKAMWTPFVPPDRCDAVAAPMRVDQITAAPEESKSPDESERGSRVETARPGPVASPSQHTVDPLGRQHDPGGFR